MANGIKLRRGLQTALAGTIAEGELVMATDTGKLGLKKGSTEHFVDLPTLVDAVATLQSVSTPNNLIENRYLMLTANSNYDTFKFPIARLNPNHPRLIDIFIPFNVKGTLISIGTGGVGNYETSINEFDAAHLVFLNDGGNGYNLYSEFCEFDEDGDTIIFSNTFSLNNSLPILIDFKVSFLAPIINGVQTLLPPLNTDILLYN